MRPSNCSSPVYKLTNVVLYDTIISTMKIKSINKLILTIHWVFKKGGLKAISRGRKILLKTAKTMINKSHLILKGLWYRIMNLLFNLTYYYCTNDISPFFHENLLPLFIYKDKLKSLLSCILLCLFKLVLKLDYNQFLSLFIIELI